WEMWGTHASEGNDRRNTTIIVWQGRRGLGGSGAVPTGSFSIAWHRPVNDQASITRLEWDPTHGGTEESVRRAINHLAGWPVAREALGRLLCDGPAGLATDFDGTVSPIVSPPEAARPLPGVEQSLGLLVDYLAVVALVSGRTVADLALRIDVPGAIYVGNHGLEWWSSPGRGPARPTIDQTA